MKKTIRLILTSVFILALQYAAYCATNKKRIYDAFVTDNMAEWKRVMDAMAATSGREPNHSLELLNYLYGYIPWSISEGRLEESKAYMGQAEEILARIEGRGCCASMAEAYKAAFYGYKISMNRFMAPIHGPKSLESAKNAIASGPKNAFALIQYANIQFYMPSTFGGSKTEALEYYLRAESIMESALGFSAQDWNFINLQLMIAQSYEKTGQAKKAEAKYSQIITAEPRLGWVKNKIYPNVMSNQAK
jgi:tetratricopeptide (TPR) repeat protein